MSCITRNRLRLSELEEGLRPDDCTGYSQNKSSRCGLNFSLIQKDPKPTQPKMNLLCVNQDCICRAVKSTTSSVLSGSSYPPSQFDYVALDIPCSCLSFFFHSSFYPLPRASIEFSLPRHFPALPPWFSCHRHYHFSEHSSSPKRKHETEV